MRVDIYTRVVLTVIAVCLLWLAADRWRLQAQPAAPPIASQPAMPVVIVGWGTLNTKGEISLMMNADRSNPATDPTMPVRVVSYPMPPGPLDVRLPYTEAYPMPVGVASVKRSGEWEPIRTVAEPEPGRPRPGR